MQIYHNSQDCFYRNPSGAVTVSQIISLKILAPDAKNATLRLWINDSEQLIPMTADGQYFSTQITVPDNPCLVWYYFILEDGYKKYRYGNNSEQLGGEGQIYDCEPPSFQITVYKKSSVPEWYKNAVVYQIFPDRFNRGNDYTQRKNDAAFSDDRKGPKRYFEEIWNSVPEYDKDADGNMMSWTFYGGTLKGIEEKADYLKSYGVTAVYLNPIFSAASNHRYDTADYTKIDSLLGDEDAFRHLCSVFDKRGIKIILDGVFNHTGADSIYFDRYGNYGTGAYTDTESEYSDWFSIDKNGNYNCWWGVRDLPDVKETCPSYEKYICGENGIIQRWLACGASGWRLDVADELPDSFIEKIREATKKNNNDNLLIGEVWEDASNKISYGEKRKYFFGSELDGVMNYPFRDAVLGFVMNNIPASELKRKMLSLMENYPPENFYASLNLIGGHDRVRIMTVLGEAENIPREMQKDFVLSEWYYAIAKKRLRMLSAIQYASPGVPCIYYGDEAGMQGHSDPYNRKPFPWGHEDTELTYHYRMLGLIYKEHSVLKNGDFVPFCVGDDVYGFSRNNENETIVAVMNRHYTEHIKVDFDTDCEYALELLTSKNLEIKNNTLSFTVGPLTAMLILLKKHAPARFCAHRAAGVICHLNSIPGSTLGKNTRDFIDYIAESGMRLWQTLPLNPAGLGNSPYHSPAVFAGNTKYTDMNELPSMDGYEQFCLNNSYWLDDFCLYTALSRKNNGTEWQKWPEEERDRLDTAELMKHHSDTVEQLKTGQYYFFSQWQDIKKYANGKGISIIGDMPVYVAPDSADLWAHREDFNVDKHGHLITHAGVPPDCFTPEGQDWGNPLYNWDHMKRNGYRWWLNRFAVCAERFDYIRLDHFRSFSEYFSVPQGISPKSGVWQQGVGKDLFENLPDIGIIAEDLGILDPGVFNLLKLTGLPGMNVWQFSANEMQEMTQSEASERIFCSGTHDNHTLVGWYSLNSMEQDAPGRADEAISWLYASAAPWIIIPMQDMLGLDDSARLNTPGTCNSTNWSWTAGHDMLKKEISDKFRNLAEKNGR